MRPTLGRRQVIPVGDDARISEVAHAISVESTQVWRGYVGPSEAELLTGDGIQRGISGRSIPSSFDLDFHEETELAFECECGRRFRKPETAREHLEEASNG